MAQRLPMNHNSLRSFSYGKRGFDSWLKAQTIDTILELGREELRFNLPDECYSNVERAYGAITDAIEKGSEVYGSTTGFGHNVYQTIEDSIANQKNLVAFLNVGVGNPLPTSVVRRALRLQAIKLGFGLSGINPELFEGLLKFSNQKVMPKVPCYGGLGASGDLIPMAHAVLPLIQNWGIKGPRDGLSLTNTNAMMASLICQIYGEINRLVEMSFEVSAVAALALNTKAQTFSEDAYSTGFFGEHCFGEAASILTRRFVANGARKCFTNLSRKPRPVTAQPTIERSSPLQERYSIRCSVMVLGHCLETMDQCEKVLLREALSVADNPHLIKNLDANDLQDVLFHGGKFYSVSLAHTLDRLTDVLVRVGDMVDRQVCLLVTENYSHGLPANLEIASDDHVKGIHQLISSLMQSIRLKSTPSFAASSPAESNNQDILPATMSKALLTGELVELSRHLMKGATFVAKRALVLRKKLEMPDSLKLSNWPEWQKLTPDEMIRFKSS